MECNKHSLEDIFRFSKIKHNIKEIDIGKDFRVSDLYNYNRSCGYSYEANIMQSMYERRLLKISSFYITDITQIRDNDEIIKKTRVYKKLPMYSRESESENIYLAYVYENINPLLDVEIQKKVEIPLTLVNYKKVSELNLYIKEYDFIITKDNYSFEEFFNLLLIQHSQICIITRIFSANELIEGIYAYVIDKTDDFNTWITQYIENKNIEIQKKMIEIQEHNPLNEIF